MPGRRPARPKSMSLKTSDAAVYALMLEVERYESLAEDMEALAVTSLAEVRHKIAALHAQIDATGEA